MTDGALAGWNTKVVPDGDYELRVSVTDTLGLTGSALVRVVVDNEAPWADETSPARVSAATGGDVYTTDGDVHLYFPPRCFATEAVVSVNELSEDSVPDTLPGGASRVLAGYEISWGDVVLDKPAALEIAYSTEAGREALTPPAPRILAIYASGADSTWSRLGGTIDGRGKLISCAIPGPGRYAIFAEPGGISGPATLSDLAVVPRAFSPRGAFASDDAAISFTLGRPGPVTVKIYNRAGRLVREVASGQPMNAGANLVRWDGRDSEANQVEDGLYLVVVEALGKTQTKTVAIVR